MPQKNKFSMKAIAQIIWQNKAIVILLVLLGGILTITAPNLSTTAADPVMVGLVREPNAYCAFTEINSYDSRYSITIADSYSGLITSLNEGKLDAAILPAQYLNDLDGGKISALAATSYLNLVAVENGSTVYSIADLNGRTAIMPESIKNSLESKMLNLLILKANTHVEISFESDEAIAKRAQESDFEVMILRPYQAAQVLLENSSFRSCFNTANQWLSLMGTQPPAGCLIAARNDVIDAKSSGLMNFLAGVKASINFINDKHKKAATLITQSGLGEDTAAILKAIPHMMYTYQNGSGLAESLKQLTLLTTTAP